MGYLIFEDLKPGDRVTIINSPWGWSNVAGGAYGINRVDYPYTLTIKNIVHYNKRHSGIPHLAIEDTNGYGWSISNNTMDLFRRNTVIDNRLSKIKKMNQ